MEMDDQWHELLLLADAAVLVSEKENTGDDCTFIAGIDFGMYDNKKRIGSPSSSLSDHHHNAAKRRRIVFSFCRDDGQKETFVLGNNGGFEEHFPTFITKKKRMTNPRRKRLISSFSSSSSSSSSSSGDGVSRVSEMPASMRKAIAADGGGEFLLVAEKALFKSDVERNKNRLSMPGSALQARPEEFLKEEERLRLKDPPGVAVTAVDEEFRKYKLTTREWKMGKNPIYDLIAEWNSVVENNALGKNDVVQLWAFRRRGLELGFAVVKI